MNENTKTTEVEIKETNKTVEAPVKPQTERTTETEKTVERTVERKDDSD